MCDYSLMGVPNRLAQEGEDLIVYEFGTGSRGLTTDTCVRTADASEQRHGTLRTIVTMFFGTWEPERVAVCVPPGARLLLGDIPEHVQRRLAVGSTEEVTFTQLTATPHRYRDAVRFKNGREMLLQDLDKGQRAKVLQLSLPEEPIRSDWKAAELFQYRSGY